MGRGIKTVYIFEDEKYRNFLPLVWLRPVFDLRVGILTIFEKWEKKVGKIDGIIVREYLKELCGEIFKNLKVNVKPGDGKVLFINGRALPGKEFPDVENLEEDTLIVSKDGDIVAYVGEPEDSFYTDIISLEELLKKAKKKVEVESKVLGYMWEIIGVNGEELRKDWEKLGRKGIHSKLMDGVYVLGDEIYIAEGVEVYPNVVIDALEGPVYIDEDVRILPNAFLKGPLYIGKKSLIKVGAKIYEDVSIGPVCKIGGEVEASVFHSYSNKQHEGFVGHSYIGSWVNLGADTNTSDLRNNYGSVKVRFFGERVDTGMQFLGTMMGDHTKTGINTMLNTGTIAGAFCNIYGADFPPKFIPSFSWGGGDSFVTHDLEKAIITARRVMARRKVELSETYEKVIRKVFELTQKERDEAGVS